MTFTIGPVGSITINPRPSLMAIRVIYPPGWLMLHSPCLSLPLTFRGITALSSRALRFLLSIIVSQCMLQSEERYIDGCTSSGRFLGKVCFPSPAFGHVHVSDRKRLDQIACLRLSPLPFNKLWSVFFPSLNSANPERVNVLFDRIVHGKIGYHWDIH
jgi:hypothetical protein